MTPTPRIPNAAPSIDSKGPRKPPASGLGGPPGSIAMGMKAEKPADFKGTLKRLLGELKDDRWKFVLALLCAVIAVVATVLGPKIMSLATNKIVEGVTAKMANVPGAGIDFNYIGKVMLVLIGLYALSALFVWFQQNLTLRATQRLVYRLRTKVAAKLDRLPLSFFDSMTHGEILSRITIDIDVLSTNMQQILSQLLTAMMTIVGITIMMFWISPILAVIALVSIPLTFGVTMLLAPRSQKYFSRQQAQLGNINSLVEENYSAHIIVKSYNQEKRSLKDFTHSNDLLYDSAYRAQFISSAMMPLVNFIGNLEYVAIVVVAALLSAAGRLPIGDILAFIQYIQQYNQPLSQTAQIANIIQGSIAASERVFLLLDEEEEAFEDPINCRQLSRKDVKGHVEGSHIAFSYREDKPLIRDLSFTALPGQTVAIVGPTGAGKTTIVNLLMRFYEIQGGKILIDGIDTKTMSRECVRKEFGMVLQDTWLFNGTIRDNIAYGRDGATEEEIIEASKIALADHFVRTLPHGYDTILTEDADNISVGQRQLLTIARAVLADAPILILDEATSSVDTRTERMIQEAMTRLMTGRTSFVIAHRLSTIRDADLILVMNEGAVIESGTHDALLAENGFYADLYNSQFEEVE